MEFHIEKDLPWLAAQLEHDGQDTKPLDQELKRLATPPRQSAPDDLYLTPAEFRARSCHAKIRPATRKYLSLFFKRAVAGNSITIKTDSGRIFEEVRFFDNQNGVFDPGRVESPYFLPHRKDCATDLIASRDPHTGGWQNITAQVLDIANYLVFQFYRFDETTREFVLSKEAVDFDRLVANIRRLDSEAPPDLGLTGDKKRAWEHLDILNGLNLTCLMTAYRIWRTTRFLADEGCSEIPLSGMIDYGDIRSLADFLPVPRMGRKRSLFEDDPGGDARALEKKFSSDLMTSLVSEFKRRPTETAARGDELSLIVIHASHVIRATKGRHGIDVLEALSHPDWETVLADADNALAIASALASAVQDASDEDGKALQSRLLAILVSDDPRYRFWFKMVVATATLMAQKNNPDFFDRPATLVLTEKRDLESLRAFADSLGMAPESVTVGRVIFDQLAELHQPVNGRSYPYPGLIELVLDALGDLSRSSATAKSLRQAGFEFCARFYGEFTSFVDKTSSRERQESDKHGDRRVILKTLNVMAAIDPVPAEEEIFAAQFDELDPTINPRTDKPLAYNAYYKHIGGAETLARLSRRPKLAFKRRIDQDNNDWGRLAEKAIRENELFRLEFLKEAQAALDPSKASDMTAVEKSFDPDGILTRNLCYVHILRYLFQNRALFDPAVIASESFNSDYLESLNFAHILKQTLPLSHYEKQARDFDDWLLKIEDKNPDFLIQLEGTVRAADPKVMRLPFQIFFVEMNETEIFQYAIDPDKAPAAVLNCVGRIRSWTSGYHGRVLTRMQVFFDQDEIRRERAANPSNYRRPEEYYDRYAANICQKRFEKTILPALSAAETGDTTPSHDFDASEALLLLKHFDESSFAAYLPAWVLHVIAHRFVSPNGHEDFRPMRQAFKLLAGTRFSRDEMRELFFERGYLADPGSLQPSERHRQKELKSLALRCLSHLKSPSAKAVTFPEAEALRIRRRIARLGGKVEDLVPESFNMLKTKLLRQRVGPGDYYDYKREARQLLKSGRPEAIQLLLEEALSEKAIDFPKNAPLAPLFRGLLGLVVTDKIFEDAIFGIATSSSSSSKGLKSLVNFSAILVKWGEKNRIDITRELTTAFASIKATPRIRELQDAVMRVREQIAAIEKEIETLRTEQSYLEYAEGNVPSETPEYESRLEELRKQKAELEKKLRELETQRNTAIVALATDPLLRSDRALSQIITSMYNSIRKQYLKEVLITGGNVTGRLVENHLENVLIPQKQALLQNPDKLPEAERRQALRDVEKRIAFLMDVLTQMEGV